MVRLFDPATRAAPPVSQERLADADVQARKLGPLATLRDGTLARTLGPLEEKVRAAAPLPVTYDVTRMQPPFFAEFTYTELFDSLFVAPQSTEAAARLAASAAADEASFSAFDYGAAAIGRVTPDKYVQEAGVDPDVRRVVFLPGSNLLTRIVAKEILVPAMRRDSGLFLKPHPLTNEETLRLLGREFGYHRILRADASGWAYLRQAEEVFVTTSTQMGLYAVLLDIPIRNISAFGAEPRGAYFPFYRLLWALPPAEARRTLERTLNSPLSGVMHPDDPRLDERLDRYFDYAMGVRRNLRPLVEELTPAQWSDALAAGDAR